MSAVASRWNLVRLQDVAPSPWRNGAGVTRELLAWPEGAEWIWRMSVAEVDSSGPFSHFEGVQRWFAVLDGAGARLTLGPQTHCLNGKSEPLCFDGALAAECELKHGPTQDFNLMLRQDCATARMLRLAGSYRADLALGATVAVYANHAPASLRCGNGSLSLPAHTLAWRTLADPDTVHVEADDALWMEITTWD